ncbi:MAG: hypothetical protein H6Q15_1594 [Bacteroidetes bacterium]|nr:hypothetical protein [Bacteroidota bacterium]
MKRILNWKLFLFAASLLLSSLSFVACNPDKEDEDTNVTTPNYKELIIGKWGIVKECEEDYFNGVIESVNYNNYDPSHEDYYTVTFTSNGKAIFNHSSGADTTDYYILNNDLYLAEGGENFKQSIGSLNSSSLNLYISEDDGDGYSYKMTSYYTRISK